MTTHNPDVICIAEPLIKPPTLLPPVICRHGFSANFLHNDIPHRVGNLWVFWREGLAISLVSLSHQQITVCVNSFLMSFVHASSSYGLRRELWQDLSQLRMNNEAWAVIGDFNIVSAVVERKGGCRPCLTAMNEFNFFIHSNALIDSTTLGYKFSWGMWDGGAKFSHESFLITALLWAGTLASPNPTTSLFGLERLGLTMSH
ncbi:hypothetical protein IFM89_037359 [Coptis chinensis]|uniref:Endonuclease/exonuclease/phosphatase domain-containing protein n=1 Tax=Coptis chinensis TaxID=261450 RepID=A0A835IJE5_9MAGN|nr:hypothetical protein IFM89_037359 [Coptis chinensis]